MEREPSLETTACLLRVRNVADVTVSCSPFRASSLKRIVIPRSRSLISMTPLQADREQRRLKNPEVLSSFKATEMQEKVL